MKDKQNRWRGYRTKSDVLLTPPGLWFALGVTAVLLVVDLVEDVRPGFLTIGLALTWAFLILERFMQGKFSRR